MLTTVMSYLTGRAAKAGLAAIIGALGAPAVVAGAEVATGTDAGMTLVGYLLIGVAQGFISWAGVYFKANKPSGGLY